MRRVVSCYGVAVWKNPLAVETTVAGFPFLPLVEKPHRLVGKSLRDHPVPESEGTGEGFVAGLLVVV